MKLITVALLLTPIALYAEGHKNAIWLKKSTYKGKWPLKGAEYSLGCMTRKGRPLVYLSDTETAPHGINGAARGLGKKMFGWPDGLKLLKKGKIPFDLQPFIKSGLNLCGK